MMRRSYDLFDVLCAGLSKILLILGRLRRFLPGPKSDREITSTALF
jgi:hypothetical protein